MCDHPTVEEYFARDALLHMEHGYARTFVAFNLNEGMVVGFYAFICQSYTSAEHARHWGIAYGDGKPNKSLAAVNLPAPGFYLMFLGVRSGLQRRGIGSFLMLNLIGRLENYAKLVGGRFITTLPDHEDPERRRELVAFYKQFDFRVASRFNNLMVRKLA